VSDLDIHVIDFQSALASAAFTESLKNTGFAVIKNHPINIELVNAVYDEWKIFFNSDNKHDYKFNLETQDGYFPFGEENAKGYTHRDLKEFFQIYPWGQYPNSLSKKTMELYSNLCDISGTLLSWVEDNCPEEVKNSFSEPLSKMIDTSPQNMLRIIHYPPLRATDSPEEVRAAAHEDINLLTILCAATSPGLQAGDLDGSWIDVPTDPGMIAVNTGDMLQMATDGYFPSTTHRVINPPNDKWETSRLSMPLFLHPHDHVQLSKTHTAGSYLKERLEEIGLV